MSRLAPLGCRECEDRYPACQDTCPKMIEWRAEHLRRKKQKRDAENEDAAYRSFRREQFDKQGRPRKKR